MQYNMKTSRQQTLPFGEEKSTCLQEDSHVSRFPSPANEEGQLTTVISGRKCCEQYARFAPAGSWARTFSELLIGTTEWYSSKCMLTWKLKGTKSKRLYFQLAVSMPRTDEIERGLLLTPTAVQTCESPERMRERAEKNGYKNGTKFGSLASQVVYGGDATKNPECHGREVGELEKERTEIRQFGDVGAGSADWIHIQERIVANTNKQRRNQFFAAAEPGKTTFGDCEVGDGCQQGPSSYTDSEWRYMSPREGKKTESVGCADDGQSELRRESLERNIGLYDVSRNIADSEGAGLPSCATRSRQEQFGGSSERNKLPRDWSNFPTQSPVRSRDDGFPIPMDGITVSKWRAESIKAYGNAIVPQVAYKIFEAINYFNVIK